jgi:MFS family permease
VLSRARAALQIHGPAFARLLASDALMLLGVMVGQVAVPWWVAREGGARHLAVFGVVNALLTVTGMLTLSPLGDRYPKRRLIVLGLSAYAIGSFGMATMATLHRYALAPLLVLSALQVLSMAMITALSTSLVSELVRPASLASAIGLQQSAQSTGRLVGPAIGGLVLAGAGTAVALWLHAALLALGAVVASRLPATHEAPVIRKPWWQDLRAGLRANWAIPMERRWTLVNGLSWMFLYPAFTMLVPLKVQSLQLSASWLGFCEAALSLGMLAGAVGASGWLVERAGRYGTRVGAAVVQGMALAVVGFTRHPGLLVVGFALAGLTNSAMGLVGLTHRTLARPRAFRARMYASSAMTTQLAGSVGPAVAGAALAHWPVHTVYTGFGLLAGGLSLGLAFVPGFKAFMALEPEHVDGWYGRMHPEAFPPE